MIELHPQAILDIMVRATVVYLALLAMFRLAGKRELGQMSVFDFVVILIIANAVQNAMIGSDTSLTGGLVAAGTLVIADRIVDRAGFRFAWLEHRLTGNPTLLVHNGQVIEDHLRREGITVDQVMMALREHGIETLPEARSAVLEVDGTISVIPGDQPMHRTRRRVRGRKPAG